MDTEIKLFSDFIDAFGKVISGIKKIIDLPKQAREEIRNTLAETFKMLDSTINMVNFRLTEILRISDEIDFKEAVSNLSFDEKWKTVEREMRLCSNLRHSLAEWKKPSAKFLNKISTSDWNEAIKLMEGVLNNESALAGFISSKFWSFLSSENTYPSTLETADFEKLKSKIKEIRKALDEERIKLIQMEIGIYNLV